MTRAGRFGSHRRRWVGLGAVIAMCAVIPAALALACNPQAYLTVGSQYAPGDSVRVSGSFFKNDTNITVSIDRTGQSATVRTSANGAFQATFALPANAAAGGYTVQAIGFEANGDVIAGLPARGSFSVAAAAAPAPASAPTAAPAAQPSVQSSAPAPSPTATAAPAARPTPRPVASAPPVSGFREPSVVSEPAVQSSRPAPASRQSATRSGRATAPSPDTATVNGRAVFGGSVAPAVGTSSVSVPAPAVSVPAPAVAATTGSPPATRSSGRPAGANSTSASPRAISPVAVQAATDDVWGSVSSGRSPSLLSATGDGASVSSQPAGSQLALGLLLLGIGGVLVGGLAVADTRRRVRAR